MGKQVNCQRIGTARTESPPHTPTPQEGSASGVTLGSRLVRGDQGAAGSPGAPLPRVLLGQGSAQHTPGPSIHWDAPSWSGTLCDATCDPLGQSRSTLDHAPRAPLWSSVVGWRKPQVTPPTTHRLPQQPCCRHGGDVSSVLVRDPPPPPPPPPCPPGQLSCQGSTAPGHTYGGAEGAQKMFFIPLAHFVHFAPQHYP